MIHEIVETEEKHIVEFAHSMQEEDIRSAWALAHLSPEEAIRHSVKASRENNTWLTDGEVMAIYGVSEGTILSPYANAWMLGGKGPQLYPKHFLRGSKVWVEGVLDKHQWLVSYVDARNLRSIRWLEWLGYEIFLATPIGIEQMPFHKVELRK
jgi:hypothetical protein